MSCTGALIRQPIRWGVVPLALAAVLLAFAFDAEPGVAASGAAAPQQAEDGGSPEANLPYLFAVYIITWLAFFGYVFMMSRRQREMRREIDALKQALDEREKDRAET